jgi:hypothetical protein
LGGGLLFLVARSSSSQFVCAVGMLYEGEMLIESRLSQRVVIRRRWTTGPRRCRRPLLTRSCLRCFVVPLCQPLYCVG